MTKKEQKEWQDKLDKLKKELLIANQWNALRRTSSVARDVKPPEGVSEYRDGWDYNVHSKSVMRCWTSCVSHGRLKEEEEVANKFGVGSQNVKHLYSTKLMALRALRHEIEKMTARELYDIDLLIQQEAMNTKDDEV